MQSLIDSAERYSIVLQHVALLLEATGILLIFWEVRRPQVTKRLEQFIDGLARDLADIAYPDPVGILGMDWYGNVAAILATAVLGIAGALLFYFDVMKWSWWLLLIPLVWVVLWVVMLRLFMFVVATLAAVLHALDAWSGGRAVTSLGAILALLGFVTEVYQVIVIWLPSIAAIASR